MANVLITGANRGLGLGFVKKYLKNNAQVMSTTRDATVSQELLKLKEKYPDDLEIFELDLLRGSAGCSLRNLIGDSPISFQSDVNDPVDVRVSTVGRIQPHCEVKIVEDDGSTCAVGQTGELWTKGYLVMKGYWNDPEATQSSIENGWMKTGDLATIDHEGFCRIVGRKKDMVIRGGENIYPAEIGEFLSAQKGIVEAHVFGIPDEKFGEQIVAWIISEKGAALDETSIQNLCKNSLAYYKVPAIVRFVEEVPLTVTGKPQKFKMREIMLNET